MKSMLGGDEVLRLLVVAQYFPPRRSTFSSRWAWLTTKLAESGHQVEVVALMSTARQLGNLRHAMSADPPPERVRVHPVLPPVHGHGVAARAGVDILMGLQAFARAVRVPNVDVVVASAPTAVTIPIGWMVAKIRRRPFVLDLRDAWPELMENWREWDDDGTGLRRGVLKRSLIGGATMLLGPGLRRLRADADAVIVTTEGLAEQLRQDGLTNTHVVRNTSAKPWTHPLPPPPRDAEQLNVLYMGNVGRAQLLATAVRAAALASQRGVAMTLRIVGSGPQWQAVHDIARDTGAPVEFHERIPTHQVLPHYEWADSVLVSLRGWEALAQTVPSKLYEVMLTGRHISGSVRGETAELIKQLRAGDIVPPEDPDALAALWAELASDRSKLRVSTEGRRWVEEDLSVERLTAAFDAVVQEVAGARR